MKKSFILSLVMVVVLIASLATATYAWYTSQNVVNVRDVTLYTAKTGATLVVAANAVVDPTYGGKYVTITMNGEDQDAGINPMIINSASSLNSGLVYSDLAFWTATLNDTRTASATAGIPATIASVTETKANGDSAPDGITNDTDNLIYVANPGNAVANYKVKVTITDTAAVANNGLRVAVFGGAAATTKSNLTLIGIWAAGDTDIYRAETVTGKLADASGIIADSVKQTENVYASGSTSNVQQTLAAYAGTVANNKYTVVAWYEGSNITNEFANKSSGFAVEFVLD